MVAVFEVDLPGLEAEGDAGAGIENGLIERVLAELGSDLGKVRSEINALALDLMAFNAANVVAEKNLRATVRVTFQFHQFGNSWQSVGHAALGQGQQASSFA